MSDVLLIDNSIQQETVLVPVTAVQPDLVTQTDVVVYVPLASKNAHGIVKIGEGLHITPNGLLSFDRSEVTIKELALNGTLLVPDGNKRVNIVLHKKDVGLANVDNTSDLDKPISTAVQNALDLLNTDLTDDILDVDDRLIVHIHDFDNPHRVTKHQVGLGNVDNTSDADKPISRATQRELSRIQGLIKGGENAVSYNSYEALVNDFNILGPDVYNVGQSVFISTLKVPDLWVYGVEEEFEEFVYIDDSTIESILKIDGTFKVGYYRLAALDTLKVDLSNYVTLDGVQSISGDKDFTGLLTLNNVRIATEDDLPREYIKNASVDGNTLTITNQDDNTIDFVGEPAKYVKSVTSENGVLTLTDQDDNEITFSSKEPDLSGYLPLTAGSSKPLTDILYANNGVRIGSSEYLRFVNEARFITPSKVVRIGSSDAYNGDLLVMTQSYLRPGGNNTTLGNSSNQWKEIYGATIYQNGKQVANADDLSAVTDATLSSDSKTLTITKRDGTSFNFQGGGGSDVDLSGYVQYADIINNLTSTSTNKTLAAYQGKVLNDTISQVQQQLGTLSGKVVTKTDNQPIGGVKTFTGTFNQEMSAALNTSQFNVSNTTSSNPGIVASFKAPNMPNNTSSIAMMVGRSLSAYDCGFFQFFPTGDANSRLALSLFGKDEILSANGNGIVKFLNTPQVNGTNVATTAWVNKKILDDVYPIGSIYLTVSTGKLSSSPASWLGGTWTRLPAGYALWTATSGAGGTIAASLPNIKGTIDINGAEGDISPATGAFTKTTRREWGAGHTSGNIPVVTFNASNYNSIYSDSATTVQPPAYKVYAWRRTA